LAFNTLREPRDWSDAVVKRLQLVAQVFTNAIARRRHELSQQESEGRLEAAADLAGLAFYEVDFGERVAFIDDRFRDVCGVPPDRGQGLQPVEFWMEHVHPDDRQRVLDQRQQLHDGKLERLSIEYRFLHPVHEERWFSHTARVPRRDAAGRTVNTFGVLRDITNRKRREEALWQSLAEIE
jgi:PAS domain S-box-containing protein